MKTLNRKEISLLTLNQITGYSNQLAMLIGEKSTKRFATKPAAIERADKHTGMYLVYKTKMEQEQDAAKPTPKPVKQVPIDAPVTPEKPAAPKEDLTGLELSAKRYNLELGGAVKVLVENPTGTIEDTIFKGIYSGNDTVGKLVIYIIENHKLPRSKKPVDFKYAFRNIKLFVARGTIKIG